jgi:predicted nucleic acid-binding Zn ribbon protein
MSKDKIRAKLKQKRRQEKQNKIVKYICIDCGIEEDIPENVVKHFDIVDIGDISEPPRFSCEECGGEMRPIKYTSVHGIEYIQGQ